MQSPTRPSSLGLKLNGESHSFTDLKTTQLSLRTLSPADTHAHQQWSGKFSDSQEFEKLIGQLGNNGSAPITPTSFLNPHNITEDQESFANNFTKRLDKLKEEREGRAGLSSIAVINNLPPSNGACLLPQRSNHLSALSYGPNSASCHLSTSLDVDPLESAYSINTEQRCAIRPPSSNMSSVSMTVARDAHSGPLPSNSRASSLSPISCDGIVLMSSSDSLHLPILPTLAGLTTSTIIPTNSHLSSSVISNSQMYNLLPLTTPSPGGLGSTGGSSGQVLSNSSASSASPPLEVLCTSSAGLQRYACGLEDSTISVSAPSATASTVQRSVFPCVSLPLNNNDHGKSPQLTGITLPSLSDDGSSAIFRRHLLSLLPGESHSHDPSNVYDIRNPLSAHQICVEDLSGNPAINSRLLSHIVKVESSLPMDDSGSNLINQHVTSAIDDLVTRQLDHRLSATATASASSTPCKTSKSAKKRNGSIVDPKLVAATSFSGGQPVINKRCRRRHEPTIAAAQAIVDAASHAYQDINQLSNIDLGNCRSLVEAQMGPMNTGLMELDNQTITSLPLVCTNSDGSFMLKSEDGLSHRLSSTRGLTASHICERDLDDISVTSDGRPLCGADGRPLSPGEQQLLKVERKRERNRLAARRCRERKVSLIQALEGQISDSNLYVKDLEKQLERTRAEVSQFRQHIEMLAESYPSLREDLLNLPSMISTRLQENRVAAEPQTASGGNGLIPTHHLPRGVNLLEIQHSGLPSHAEFKQEHG